MTLERKEILGATPLGDDRCNFLLWAPRATQVAVHILDPRDLTFTLQPAACGYFHATVEGVAPGALYRYRLDGQKERPDPASRFQPQGVHGPSQVVGNRFEWNDSAWRGLPLQKYVLYEIHVGTFTAQGTFDAGIPRIAVLKDLGITAVEIMPVSQFPGNRNWGYDGVYPYAVQASYGGPRALKEFVNACHQQGIAVVLDVVYNHLGPEGNYLSDFGPYFTNLYRTPWGEAVNFDGCQSDEVRRYFIEIALQWITDFHMDALRLDAIHAVVDPSARPFLQELGAAVHQKAAELQRDVYLFPESNRNDARVVNSPEVGGWGFDAVWNDDFHHSLHVLLTGEQDGYYQDFRGVDDLARAYRDGFVYTGQYSKFRQRRHGNSSRRTPAERLIVFAQNHDQVGNRLLGDRLPQATSQQEKSQHPISQEISLAKSKLAAGVLLLSPYIPLLFMGEEYGETAPFQYFVSHEDPELIEAVRCGRKEEFARFNWQGEIPDPQSEETFIRSKLHWELQAGGRHRVLWYFYRELLRLRRTLPSLAALDKNTLEVETFDGQNVLLVKRWHDSSRIFAAFHFAPAPKTLTLPIAPGRWKKILDSADRRWAREAGQTEGSQTDQTEIKTRNATPECLTASGELRLSLAPWAFLLFAQAEEGE